MHVDIFIYGDQMGGSIDLTRSPSDVRTRFPSRASSFKDLRAQKAPLPISLNPVGTTLTAEGISSGLSESETSKLFGKKRPERQSISSLTWSHTNHAISEEDRAAIPEFARSLTSIKSQPRRVLKLAEVLSQTRPLGTMTHSRQELSRPSVSDPKKREVLPGFGFRDEILEHANALVNAPLEKLAEVDHFMPPVPEPEEAVVLARMHKDFPTVPRNQKKTAELIKNEYVADYQGRLKTWKEEVTPMLDDAAGPAVRHAVLIALKSRLRPDVDDAPGARELVQPLMYADEPDSASRRKRIVAEIAALPPSEKLIDHVQTFLTGEPGWSYEISDRFGLEAADKKAVEDILTGPLQKLDALFTHAYKGDERDDAAKVNYRDSSDAKMQELLLGQIKSEILETKSPGQEHVRDVMLVCLSNRLTQLGTPELRLDALQFINEHMNERSADARGGWRYDNVLSREDHGTVVNNMLSMIGSMLNDPDCDNGSPRKQFLVNMSAILSKAGRREQLTDAMQTQREALFVELSEQFTNLHNAKRDSVKLLGQGMRDRSKVAGSPEKLMMSQKHRVEVVQNMLAAVKEMNSRETQRQVLVEISRVLNSDEGLDAESKITLIKELGTTIPSFDSSNLSSGNNMQHKAYKLYRTLLLGEHSAVISFPRENQPDSVIENLNNTPFDDVQLGEMIRYQALSLEGQPNEIRHNNGGFPSRPPIRSSLARVMTQRLTTYDEPADPEGSDKLKSMTDRMEGWHELLRNCVHVDVDDRNKVIEQFLKTVEVRDSEIEKLHRQIREEITGESGPTAGPDVHGKLMDRIFGEDGYANKHLDGDSTSRNTLMVKTREKLEEMSDIHQNMQNKIDELNAAMATKVAEQEKKLKGISRLNPVHRMMVKEEKKLIEKVTAKLIQDVRTKAALDLEKVELPHLTHIKASFTPGFDGLRHTLKNLENGLVRLPGLKKKLSERVTNSLKAHNELLPEKDQLLIPAHRQSVAGLLEEMAEAARVEAEAAQKLIDDAAAAALQEAETTRLAAGDNVVAAG